MRFLKLSGAFAIAALLLLVSVANFSTVESRFQCSGELSCRGVTRPATVYLKREKTGGGSVCGATRPVT